MAKEYGLAELLDNEGMTEGGFLANYCLESVVPGICTQCGKTYPQEPDGEDGWCDHCESNTVESGLILMGVI